MKCSNNVERLECLGPFTIAEERFCVLNITNDKTIMAVAIAGGISGPGRALVEAISAQKTHEVIVLTRKIAFFTIIAKNAASIPDLEDEPDLFTYSNGIARVIAAYLQSTRWRSKGYTTSDKLMFNDLVHLAEDIKGTTFSVAEDPTEDLETV
ncbi:hypothetical protein CFIO01_06265 [Colletotrichum fioriniae PJ7]|uniref:Uncharacterized protein n=1 Tax=Colletotrichum fioriniae PJ7 TaxID=1445577 RepID=A0A010RCP1_9PEZI|nr:hypothetical protein CFIO01_06265 [Colletotrichum fioriniae PJ7]